MSQLLKDRGNPIAFSTLLFANAFIGVIKSIGDMKKKDFLAQYQTKEWSCDDLMIKRFRTWRKRIRKGEFKKIAISQYESLPGYRTDISSWFERVYGENINDYVKK